MCQSPYVYLHNEYLCFQCLKSEQTTKADNFRSVSKKINEHLPQSVIADLMITR